MSINFNENTRVQVPATLHLCKLGYTYLDKIDSYVQFIFKIDETFVLHLKKCLFRLLVI